MKNILFFISGAAIGSVITWKILEKKYRDLAEEEIQSVIDMFESKYNVKKESSKQTSENKKEENNDKINYSNILKTNDYSDSDDNYTVNVEYDEDYIYPYIINGEDFDTLDDYGCKTLTYYADGVITDEIDQIVPEVEALIGADTLSHFPELNSDVMYVRNENDEMDYEIIKSKQTFSEINRGNQ